MTSSRRSFLSSAAGATGALAAQQRGGAGLPQGRISPMDGVQREKVKITGVKIISLAGSSRKRSGRTLTTTSSSTRPSR
jgi:hypothetical protein